MEELVRKVELNKEAHDNIIGVCIFRINPEGQKEVLLVQHSVTGKWYFPGGKVRENENMKDALRRELKEEIGIEYDGKFGEYVMNSYEIGGKRLAIGNVTATDPITSEPIIQKSDAIKGLAWTTDPLRYDLTEQAEEIVKSKHLGTHPMPQSQKIKHPKVNKLENLDSKRKNSLAKSGYVELNKIFNYHIEGNELKIHVLDATDLGLSEKKRLLENALKNLAVLISQNAEIKEVSATSWIVAKNPKFLESLGFIIDKSANTKLLLGSKRIYQLRTRPLGRASISREEFLHRYLSQ